VDAIKLYLNILHEEGNMTRTSALENLYTMIENLLADNSIYRCDHCGFGGKKLHWQCPSCKQWDTTRPL